MQKGVGERVCVGGGERERENEKITSERVRENKKAINRSHCHLFLHFIFERKLRAIKGQTRLYSFVVD